MIRDMPHKGDRERLWAHVRSLPCMRCDVEGRTQAAHSNQSRDGKALSLKAYCWRVAALCVECHTAIDSGSQMSYAERVAEWDDAHRRTVGLLFMLGLIRPT